MKWDKFIESEIAQIILLVLVMGIIIFLWLLKWDLIKLPSMTG